MHARMLAAAAGIAATILFPALPPLPFVVALLPLLLPLCLCTPRGVGLGAVFVAGMCWGALCGHWLLGTMLPSALEGKDAELRLCIEGLPERRQERGLTVWRLRARLLEPAQYRGMPAWQGRAVEFSWYGEGDFQSKPGIRKTCRAKT